MTKKFQFQKKPGEPDQIQYRGWGIIIDESRNKVKTPSNMRMETNPIGFACIDILTQSDVRLPYDLYGKPLPKLHEFNAPRLQKALTKVKEALGINPIIDDNELAELHEDFTLSNIRDVTGDILIYDPLLQRVV